MTALIVILAIIAFFAVILSLSASFHIDYDGDFEVRLFYGPLRYKLYPARQKPEKIKAKKKKSKSKAKSKPKAADRKPQEKGKKGFFETVSDVFEIVKSVLGPAKFLLKKIRITSLDATVVVATGDAAETAKLYGEVSAAVYGAVVGLKNIITIRVKNLSVGYSFVQDENTYKVFFKVKIRLIHALCAGIRMIWNLIADIFKKSSVETAVVQSAESIKQ